MCQWRGMRVDRRNATALALVTLTRCFWGDDAPAAAPLGVAMTPADPTAPAPAAALHVVTYVEVVPASADDGARLMQAYRNSSRSEAGNARSEVAQEIGRPSRFVSLQIWNDQAAFDAHGTTMLTKMFRDTLTRFAAAPVDTRLHGGLTLGANGTIAAGAVYVVSHVDVPPPKKDDVIAALDPLAVASRKLAANLRFEVLQQSSRPNHFTVLEAWSDDAAYAARTAAAPQMQFRDALGPMLGALYDERIYRALD